MSTTSPRQHDYPRWVGYLAVAPPAFFGLVSVLGAGPAWPVVLAAVTIALLPWLVSAAGRHVDTRLFAAWVIIPLALINVSGEALGVDLGGRSHTQFTLMMLVWLVGELAAVAPRNHVIGGTTAIVAVIAGRGLVEPSFGHAWMFWTGGAGIALLTGLMLRRQQRTLSELRDAQAKLAAEAARHERQRIAREVHDVVAHTLTVTLMHLQAARRALDHDTSAAREALDDAETLGRRSLADIRGAVGLLREDAEGPDRHALPDTTDIPTLLDSYRSAGVSLRDEIDLDDKTLTPATRLALYRLAQESLSNAVTHAPGARVDLDLGVDGQEVVLRVSNQLTEPPVATTERRGLGLTGMAERVELLGGTFEAGARDGVWRVRARFPARVADDVEVSA